MNGMLLEILSVSLPMTALILLLWLFSRFFGQRFTAKCRYVVWMLVLLRMCLPMGTIQFPSLVQVSITAETEETAETVTAEETEILTPSYIPEAVEISEISPPYTYTTSRIQEEETSEFVYAPYLPEEEVPQPAAEASQTEETDEPDSPAVQEPVTTPVLKITSVPFQEKDTPASPPSLLTVLGIVWLAGAVGYLALNIISYQRYVRRLRNTCIDASTDILRIHGQFCEKYGIRHAPELRLSHEVRSPMLCGYFHPCVILPVMDLTQNQTVGILAHELTHYRRRDLWIKFACVLGCALHWFNPAVHLAASRCCAEMELSCDEAVLAGLDQEARRSYGNVMLDIVRSCSRKNIALTTYFNPKNNAVRERFLNIMDISKKKQGFAVILAAGILCALAGLVFAYDVEPPADDEEYIKISNNVSIRIGYGSDEGKSEETETVTLPEAGSLEETEESVPVEEIYERSGLDIPVLSEMVEHVTIRDGSDESTLLEFYHTASLENGADGWLFSIVRHDYHSLLRDRNNHGWLQYFAAEPDNSWFYCIYRPTDVRWDPADEAASAEYTALSQMKSTVAQRILEDNGLVSFTGSAIPETVRLDTAATYPSPDYLSQLEYSEAYGWLLRGDGAGAAGIALGDSTKTAEIWAEWVSDICCRLSIDGNVIDLFRRDAGWTTEESAFDLTFENNLPVWKMKDSFTKDNDILRKAYYGALKTDELLSITTVCAQFIKHTTLLAEPYRSGETYVPDGAVFPDRITWDNITVTESGSDEYDYLVTLPLGELYMTIKAEITPSEDSWFRLTLSGEEFHLTDPIIAEEGILREVLESLMRQNRTDYSAEIHIPDADDAVLSIRVEGEGKELHDLKDIFCTAFSAKGQTIRFTEPLDLWGAWGLYVFAAEDAVVLTQSFTSYSGNTYVITPKYTYDYHPGAFSLILYEEDNDLRYRHSSTELCDAAMRTNDELSVSLLGIATARDNFYYECGDVTLNGGKLVFYEADEYYTIDDAFDLDAEFEKLWKSASYPTIDDLFLYNGERYGTIYDYPEPDETPLPETVKVSLLYKKIESLGTYMREYRCAIRAGTSYDTQITATIHIPQLRIDTPAVTEWNSEIYSRIRQECDPILAEYQTTGRLNHEISVTYEEIICDGVVSIPITFIEQEMNEEQEALCITSARTEVYHYDIEADKFLTNEEYLLRLTDGKFAMEGLLTSLNEQNFNFWMNDDDLQNPGDSLPFAMDDIYGIVPSELDKNGFDVYLPKIGNFKTMYTVPQPVHWREYPVFTSEEGLKATYRLIRAEDGYRLMHCISDPRELPLPEENQTMRSTPVKVYSSSISGPLFEMLYSDDPYDDGINAEITYFNEGGKVFTKTMALASNTRRAEYYFEKYLDGIYDMKTLMEYGDLVRARGGNMIGAIIELYEKGEKLLESAPDFPEGIAIPKKPITSDVINYYVETGDPAHPFKFAFPLDGGWTMDVYWDISEDFEMVAEKIEFHQ